MAGPRRATQHRSVRALGPNSPAPIGLGHDFSLQFTQPIDFRSTEGAPRLLPGRRKIRQKGERTGRSWGGQEILLREAYALKHSCGFGSFGRNGFCARTFKRAVKRGRPMSAPLYPGFLTEPCAFEDSRRYWSDLVDAVLERNQRQDRWVPWLDTERDGNPMFAVWCPLRRRAIRVVQLTPHSDEPDMSYYTDVFGSAAESGGPITELVIVACPTARTGARAQDVMREWVGNDTLRQNRTVGMTMTGGRRERMPTPVWSAGGQSHAVL